MAGHILATGRGINDKVVSANICVCRNAEDLKENFKEGDVVVAKETNNDMMEQIRKASGLIVEDGGPNSHAVIPVIAEVEHATAILKTGAYVTVDAREGIISCNG